MAVAEVEGRELPQGEQERPSSPFWSSKFISFYSFEIGMPRNAQTVTPHIQYNKLHGLMSPTATTNQRTASRSEPPAAVCMSIISVSFPGWFGGSMSGTCKSTDEHAEMHTAILFFLDLVGRLGERGVCPVAHGGSQRSKANRHPL